MRAPVRHIRPSLAGATGACLLAWPAGRSIFHEYLPVTRRGQNLGVAGLEILMDESKFNHQLALSTRARSNRPTMAAGRDRVPFKRRPKASRWPISRLEFQAVQNLYAKCSKLHSYSGLLVAKLLPVQSGLRVSSSGQGHLHLSLVAKSGNTHHVCWFAGPQIQPSS